MNFLQTMSRRSWIMIAVTAVVVLLYLIEAWFFHGSPWWVWPYRTLQAPWRTVLVLGIGMIPFFYAREMVKRGRSHAYGLTLLVISMFALQIGAIGLKDWPFGLGELVEVVQHKGATTFYNDAHDLQKAGTPVTEYLRTFPERMVAGEGHNRNKPPGLTLFHYFFLKWNEADSAAKAQATAEEAQEIDAAAARSAALFGGLMIALLTALCAPAAFWMVRGFGFPKLAAWEAASFIVLTPGLVLIYPQFDQMFALLCALSIGCWARAARGGDWRWGAGFGVMMAVTLFFTFTVLVIGVLLVGTMLIFSEHLKRIWQPIVAGLVSFVLTDVLMWLTTGYNALATFRTALRTQKENLSDTVNIPRPWPQTIPWDLADFGLTSGWLGIVILAIACFRRIESKQLRWLAWLVAGQLIITAVSGLLQAEGARLWLFLVPALAIGIVGELERWSPRERTILHVCRGVILIVVCQKITFIILGTEK